MRLGSLALACAVALPGCAMYGSGSLDESSPGVVRSASITPASAQAMVQPGARKDQVASALGRANVIAFDSGWEVWVYRWPGADRSARGATELVVLFDAQGLVRKTRLRAGLREG